MLRITKSLKKLNLTKEVLNTDSYVVNSQTIRWRKPRWIPTAKSRMFKVPSRPVIPEDEKIELKRLSDNYNTQIKSLRRYLSNRYYRYGTSEINPEEQQRQFEEDYARCVEINNKWNEEQRVLREERVAEKLEEELKYARNRIENQKRKQHEKLQLIENIVRKEKEQSRNYITPDNIDAAIEKALANPVDYNFAITLKGEKITDLEYEQKNRKSVALGTQ